MSEIQTNNLTTRSLKKIRPVKNNVLSLNQDRSLIRNESMIVKNIKQIQNPNRKRTLEEQLGSPNLKQKVQAEMRKHAEQIAQQKALLKMKKVRKRSEAGKLPSLNYPVSSPMGSGPPQKLPSSIVEFGIKISFPNMDDLKP